MKHEWFVDNPPVESYLLLQIHKWLLVVSLNLRNGTIARNDWPINFNDNLCAI